MLGSWNGGPQRILFTLKPVDARRLLVRDLLLSYWNGTAAGAPAWEGRGSDRDRAASGRLRNTFLPDYEREAGGETLRFTMIFHAESRDL